MVNALPVWGLDFVLLQLFAQRLDLLGSRRRDPLHRVFVVPLRVLVSVEQADRNGIILFRELASLVDVRRVVLDLVGERTQRPVIDRDRWMIWMNENPWCLCAACRVASRWGGFQSTVRATNDALTTPKVVWMGSMGSSQAPRGWVLVLRPLSDVGDVCALVRP